MVGTAAVVLILGATRWGSYLGFSPLFLTDVLLALGLLGWFVASQGRAEHLEANGDAKSRPSALFIIFFAFVVIRALLALSAGFTEEWLRDAAPFLYSFLAFVSAASVARAGEESRRRTMKFIWFALIFHLVWTAATTFSGFAGLSVPFAGGALFQIRPDIDVAISGVAAGLFMLRVLRSRKKIWPGLALVLTVATVLAQGTRAGLISFVLSIALAYVFFYATTGYQSKKRVLAQLMVPAALVGLLLTVPQTEAGQRIIATIDSSQADTQGQLNAQGTERARSLVWRGVVDWTNEEPARQLFGSGFGNDFLTQSGTITFLEGDTYDGVRSPHNWFVGAYARLGLLGSALAVLVVMQLLATIVRHVRRIAQEPILAAAALIVVAILPVATLGVVLEAPFGAVPFWWSAGVIYTLRTRGDVADQKKPRSMHAQGFSPRKATSALGEAGFERS